MQKQSGFCFEIEVIQKSLKNLVLYVYLYYSVLVHLCHGFLSKKVIMSSSCIKEIQTDFKLKKQEYKIEF